MKEVGEKLAVTLVLIDNPNIPSQVSAKSVILIVKSSPPCISQPTQKIFAIYTL